MTRVKKSRKTGPLAPSKAVKKPWEAPKGKPSSGKAPRKGKGHKPGSRFNPAMNQAKTASTGHRGVPDPRHGSKKPIPLVAPAAPEKSVEALTRDAAHAELQPLEHDLRFQQLLHNMDHALPLTDAEQAYVDESTERCIVLSDILGLDLDDHDYDGDEDEDGLDNNANL